MVFNTQKFVFFNMLADVPSFHHSCRYFFICTTSQPGQPISCHWSLFIPPENIGKSGYWKTPVTWNGLMSVVSKDFGSGPPTELIRFMWHKTFRKAANYINLSSNVFKRRFTVLEGRNIFSHMSKRYDL